MKYSNLLAFCSVQLRQVISAPFQFSLFLTNDGLPPRHQLLTFELCLLDKSILPLQLQLCILNLEHQLVFLCLLFNNTNFLLRNDQITVNGLLYLLVQIKKRILKPFSRQIKNHDLFGSVLESDSFPYCLFLQIPYLFS